MKRIAGFLVILLIGAVSFAAPNFPALTGRVVDGAHILSAQAVSGLEQKLAAYEKDTSNQMVVATIASLEGIEIEEYGYQLGRTWQIGHKDKNNGVLFLIAPNEKKVRIEVGYGLEGELTDITSNTIIENIILPEFKKGQLEQGIIQGTEAILLVLGGGELPTPVTNEPQNDPVSIIISLIAIAWFIWLAVKHPMLFLLLVSSSRFGGSRGGGFRGGGGSFGGGGSSGSW
jgi:uncharacterized protein